MRTSSGGGILKLLCTASSFDKLSTTKGAMD